MILAETLERFADEHGLEKPDTTALREAEVRFDRLMGECREWLAAPRSHASHGAAKASPPIGFDRFREERN